MKWFKHDSDAHADAKLRRLRLKYGMQGYGLYWYCLELIARGVEKHRLTFELEHDSELIAADTGINRDLVEDMMRYMAEIGLFECANGLVTCLKMASRTDEYTAKLLLQNGMGKGSPDTVPTLSRQSPDSAETKSVLLEQNRTDKTYSERQRRRRLPDDFVLTVERRQAAEAYWHSKGRDDLDAVVQFQRFRDHHTAKGSRMADWDATWRTWYGNALEFTRKPLAAVGQPDAERVVSWAK